MPIPAELKLALRAMGVPPALEGTLESLGGQQEAQAKAFEARMAKLEKQVGLLSDICVKLQAANDGLKARLDKGLPLSVL